MFCGEKAQSPNADDLPARAEELRRQLGEDRYRAFLVRRFKVDRYALSHGLLASLRVRSMVTTNYDACLEGALNVTHGDGRYRVLTRHLATGELPWLLKLHGDIVRPETLVLTERDYTASKQRDQALRGVVQALMLTSHLLFVGYSLVDQAFLELSAAVRSVRDRADADQSPHRYAGTALSLLPHHVDAPRWKRDLNVVAVSEREDERVAARTLEIFLDRVLWKATTAHRSSAEYLPDERYDEGFTGPADVALRKALRAFIADLEVVATASPGWPTIRAALVSLGVGDEEVRAVQERSFELSRA